MKLTKEQLVLLNDVFNYAMNFINAHSKIITFDEQKKKFVLTNFEEVNAKIDELIKVINTQIEVVEE